MTITLREILDFMPLAVMLLSFTGILFLIVYAKIREHKEAKLRAKNADWSFDTEEYLKGL